MTVTLSMSNIQGSTTSTGGVRTNFFVLQWKDGISDLQMELSRLQKLNYGSKYLSQNLCKYSRSLSCLTYVKLVEKTGFALHIDMVAI